MRASAIRYLTCSVLAAILLCSSDGFLFASSNYANTSDGNSYLIELSGEQLVKYSADIKFKKAGITGIALFKESGDNIVGSMINEFGIKAFDFVYSKKSNKMKLSNVIKFIDKWYIKRTIEADLLALFCKSYIKAGRREAANDGGLVIIRNIKRGIQYQFAKIV